ncbi:MAG: hypothetical protein FWD53_07235 [Phycisphaerales bacterium]|nr:hypothetical protein [Phycisphaerales bacterium]
MAKENVGDNGTIQYKNSGDFKPLAAVWDITPNKVLVKQVDTTKLASAADESQAGTPDYGEVSVTISASPANTTLINKWIVTKQTNTFKLTVEDQSDTNDDPTEEFNAWVKEFSPLGEEIKKDEPLKSKLVLKITGVPTFTPDASDD